MIGVQPFAQHQASQIGHVGRAWEEGVSSCRGPALLPPLMCTPEPSDIDTDSVMLFRSSPHSQRRLSDLMVGVDVGEVGLGLEGHLEDLIAPELEGMPQQEDALDQRLEAAGDSYFRVICICIVCYGDTVPAHLMP